MWVKTGDEFVDDAADLSDAAVRTHMDALHWSARRMLDLHVPKRDLPRFAFSANAAEAIDELIAGKWWLDEGPTWYLAYRPEWQLSKEQVERRRNQNAQAQERGRRHRAGDHSLCLPGRCAAVADESASESAADSEADTSSDPVRFGSVRDGSVPAAQLESTTQLEEQQTHARDDGVCAVASCDRPPRRSCATCAEHMASEIDFHATESRQTA